jgi:hypothetical protein
MIGEHKFILNRVLHVGVSQLRRRGEPKRVGQGGGWEGTALFLCALARAQEEGGGEEKLR